MKNWCDIESVLIRTHQIEDPNREYINCLLCGEEIKQVCGNDLYLDKQVCKSCVDKKLNDKDLMREFIENDLDFFVDFIKLKGGY
jgi:hypothetical protein